LGKKNRKERRVKKHYARGASSSLEEARVNQSRCKRKKKRRHRSAETTGKADPKRALEKGKRKVNFLKGWTREHNIRREKEWVRGSPKQKGTIYQVKWRHLGTERGFKSSG